MLLACQGLSKEDVQMKREMLIDLFEMIRQGAVTADEAYERLKVMPFEDLGHTKVDHHRAVRKGMEEVVFGEGKTIKEISDIIVSLRQGGSDVLVTRLDRRIGLRLKRSFPEGVYEERARCFYIKEASETKGKGTVLIISAGTSDMPVAEEAYVTSTFFDNVTERLYDVGCAGIHRLFYHLEQINNARVIIAVAGMEGALPSIVAGIVGVPVIGVPTSQGYGASLGGMAALFTMLNSCATISVFNIDNGFGAAYFATLINRL